MKLIQSAALCNLLAYRIIDGQARSLADYTVDNDCEQVTGPGQLDRATLETKILVPTLYNKA